MGKHTVRRMTVTLICWSVIACSLKAAEFEFSDNRLTVRSDAMEMAIEAGTVISITDLTTGETFADEELDPEYGQGERVGVGSGSEAEFRRVSPNEGELTYTNLLNGSEGDHCLYRITVNDDTGEISLQTVYHLPEGFSPTISFPSPMNSHRVAENTWTASA